MDNKCDPNEIALKSFFLGPQAENASWVAETFSEILKRWFEWRRGRFPQDGRAISIRDQQTREFQRHREQIQNLVSEIMTRFEAEVPKFSPRYIGHMFSEISLPALFGHFIALLHNPNNISGESSRIGIQIEEEAIQELLTMCGFDPARGTGHFTSGGTVANFEAAIRAKWRISEKIATACAAKEQGLWTGSYWEAAHLDPAECKHLKTKLDPSTDLSRFHLANSTSHRAAFEIQKCLGHFEDPVLLMPEHRHYSWEKIAAVLGLGLENIIPVALDKHGTMSPLDLKRKLKQSQERQTPVALVLSVMGTTELALVDPIFETRDEIRKSGIPVWHHVDAAYGGFFCSLKGLEHPYVTKDFQQRLQAIGDADSLTIDPHKLGYVPYASGAFLLADRINNQVPGVHAPYIDFHLGDKGHFTLEGSRSSAGAVATWLTAKSIGLDANGYGRLIARTMESTQRLRDILKREIADVHMAPSDTNILCFCVGQKGESLSQVNARTKQIYDHFSTRHESAFFVSKTSLDIKIYDKFLHEHFPDWSPQKDSSELDLIRLCLMNPFLTSTEPEIDYPKAFVSELKRWI